VNESIYYNSIIATLISTLRTGHKDISVDEILMLKAIRIIIIKALMKTNLCTGNAVCYYVVNEAQVRHYDAIFMDCKPSWRVRQ
jgi:hypothetical protein